MNVRERDRIRVLIRVRLFRVRVRIVVKVRIGIGVTVRVMVRGNTNLSLESFTFHFDILLVCLAPLYAMKLPSQYGPFCDLGFVQIYPPKKNLSSVMFFIHQSIKLI